MRERCVSADNVVGAVYQALVRMRARVIMPALHKHDEQSKHWHVLPGVRSLYTPVKSFKPQQPILRHSFTQLALQASHQQHDLLMYPQYSAGNGCGKMHIWLLDRAPATCRRQKLQSGRILPWSAPAERS